MKIRRRDFVRGGLAAAAYGAVTHAWARQPDAGVQGSGSTGWAQVPGILAKIVPPVFPDQDFFITDFGAIPESNLDCLPAIRSAIEVCNQSGGGRVVVPAGEWLSNGPIELLSDVNFYTEEGASLTFGTDPEDYLPVRLVRWQGIRCYNYSPLIYAYQQENIAVTGAGSFHGQGYEVWNAWTYSAAADWDLLQSMAEQGTPLADRVFGPGHYLRPGMFEPYECNNILVEGVTFSDSPFWTMHPSFCVNVTIKNVTVTEGADNDDGCDPDSCRDVLVQGCSFYTGDDNVSLKAGLLPDAEGLRACENIVIQDCTCHHSAWSGLTIGSDTGGFVRNVFIENCTVNDCLNAHMVKANANNGGGVEDIYIRNNKVLSCHNVFALLPDNYDNATGFGPPAFTNFNMEDVTCVEAADLVFLFTGDPRLPIDGVNLSNIGVEKLGSGRIDRIANTTGLTASEIVVGGRRVTIQA